MTPRGKTWLRRLGYLFFYYLVLCALLGVVLAENTLRPPRPLPSMISSSSANGIAIDNRAYWAEVSINSPVDSQALRGWIFRPADPRDDNGNAVILLHGVGDTRNGPVHFAPFFLHAGYTVLAPDSRAHGISAGDLATYGLRESADLRAWVEYLSSPNPAHPHLAPARCVFALGESMGASVLLETLPSEPRICAAVAESPFATFREIAYDRIGQSLFLGPGSAHLFGRTLLRPVLEVGLLYARWRYGVALGGISAADALAQSSTPVLLIHGDADKNIPPRHSLMLVERAREANRVPAVEYWSVPGAGHTGAYMTARQEFEQRILAFFAAHTPPPQAPPPVVLRLEATPPAKRR